jgi:hypothetical protein
MKRNLFKNAAILCVASMVMVGCNVLQSDNEAPSTLKLNMKAETSPSSVSKTGSVSIQSGHITVTEVKMFLDEFELGSAIDDTADFEVENVIVNLPLDGSPLTVTQFEVPEGLYDELEFKIKRRPYHTGVITNDPDFDEGNRKYALIIRGTLNGEDFLFRSDKVFKVDLDLNPHLQINSGVDTELMISIDVEKWFVGKNGRDLDPTNHRDTQLIEQNIRKSFIILKRQFNSGNDDDEEDNDDDDDEEDDNDEDEE